jgi:Fur family transcriptional regulator, ferric uptake regulator
MTSTKGSAERQALRARIQETGLRCTPARLAVVGVLTRSLSPLSHGDIAGALAPLGFDRATVYRNLMELSESGLVSRLDVGDHIWRFELRTTGSGHAAEHPHFLCTECGGVSCLDGVEVKLSPFPRNKRSAVGQVTEILLKGRCPRCS